MNAHMIVYAALAWLAATLLLTVAALTVHPVLTYNQGTARNVQTTLLAVPFDEADALTYLWEGEVYRSCDVTIRRSFVDSQGVVTPLVSSFFGAVPHSDLGDTSFPISVDVPDQVAAGMVTYQAVEVPRCTWLQRLFPVAIDYPPIEFVLTRPDIP